MRLGMMAAMAGMMLLSGCEVFLDGLGFEAFDRSKAELTTPVDAVVAPEATGL